ncbi:UNVERIFIED_CONTAM: Sugar transporter ERD6-like 16 [Sesamum latifolium]|uniref:Sugar transporter ERD6-like 16 n=1 Tax=Sesamum latifolium TaxID=2727402 RepID=A0AAW2XZI0_9LAMI
MSGRLSDDKVECGHRIFSFVVPVLYAEIAPKNLRGGLATLNQLMIVCGSSIAYVLGTVVTWRALALTGLLPCILLLVGLFFIPESPRWLAKVGRQKEFEVALRKLVQGCRCFRMKLQKFKSAITVLGAMLMDKSGRRPLLTVSATGMFLGCILTGASFFIKVYIATFLSGMGASAPEGLVVLVNWLGAWAVSYTFNFLMSWSSTGTFLMYAVFSALTVVFVAKIVPETKGKTLEEIQASINSSKEGQKRRADRAARTPQLGESEKHSCDSLRLIGYNDADGSADRDEHKSTPGYAFLLGAAAITWYSKKQPCISLSTMEAKYVACTSAVQKAIWLRKFLKSLRISAHINDAVVIYCDNTAAIAYAKDPKYHGRTKHIDTRYHFIRDSIAQGEVVLRHIPTNDMIADPFTKPLRRDAFHRHVSSMGLHRI